MKSVRIIILMLALLVPFTGFSQRRGGPARPVPNVAGSIRTVDFRNFTYPLDGDRAQGYGRSSARVRNGKFIFSRKFGLEGFEVMKVAYGDLTGDGQEEAVVRVDDGNIEIGGSQNVTYTYIFSMADGRPLLLNMYCAYCNDSTAQTAYQNYYHDDTTLLYGDTATIESGLLVVETIAGPAICCPMHDVTMRFHWDGERFVLEGQPQRKKVN